LAQVFSIRRGLMAQIKAAWLDNSCETYEKWLWDMWGYAKGWAVHFPEMILWYSAAGSGGLSEAAADTFVRQVQQVGSGSTLDKRRRPTWTGALALSERICGKHHTNPVDWFGGRCDSIEGEWKGLQAIKNVRAKIASFLLRDLSLLRDYSTGKGATGFTYGDRRDRRWFDRLASKDQALFLPVDVYVHAGARLHKASPLCAKYPVTKIQADSELHRASATQIVDWARDRNFDPRDLDTYWYQLGAGSVSVDGTPTPDY
jgi:hypothetical protein